MVEDCGERVRWRLNWFVFVVERRKERKVGVRMRSIRGHMVRWRCRCEVMRRIVWSEEEVSEVADVEEGEKDYNVFYSVERIGKRRRV